MCDMSHASCTLLQFYNDQNVTKINASRFEREGCSESCYQNYALTGIGLAHTHACMHAHTHTHMHEHTHTHTHMHAHIRTHTHMHAHAYLCTYLVLCLIYYKVMRPAQRSEKAYVHILWILVLRTTYCGPLDHPCFQTNVCALQGTQMCLTPSAKRLDLFLSDPSSCI